VLDICDVPARYLMNAVRRLRIRPPDQQAIEIASRAFRFYMADVTGMLQWMARRAEEHGATVLCDAPFVDAVHEQDGRMLVSYRAPGGAPSGDTEDGSAPAPRNTIRARILVGADGAHSLVARHTGLDQNAHFLAGAEWLVENVALDRETFYLVMDHALAPGYCVWLAPHGDIAALGVAGHQRAFKPTETLRLAPKLFGDIADLGGMRVRERKGGVIPVGGRLRRVYRDDERGRVLLLGDAAGLCGAATGGGIYPALVCGRLAGQAVANEIANGVKGAVRDYLRNLPHAGRLGHYLQIEDWLRWGMDRLGSNADVAAFYGLLATPQGRQVLQHALLELPIIGMDRSFFALLRGVLGRHPRIYGSALKAAWRRVTTQS
jgi:geranylgeranyl reductase